MSDIQVAGLGTDFVEDPNISLMKLLSTYWSAVGAGGDPALLVRSDANPDGVKLGTSWWDEGAQNQVHVKYVQRRLIATRHGSARWMYAEDHNVHVFSKGKSAKDKGWKVEKEVTRVFDLHAAFPFAGVSWMELTGFRQVPDEQYPISDFYHSVGAVTLYYEKCKV